MEFHGIDTAELAIAKKAFAHQLMRDSTDTALAVLGLLDTCESPVELTDVLNFRNALSIDHQFLRTQACISWKKTTPPKNSSIFASEYVSRGRFLQDSLTHRVICAIPDDDEKAIFGRILRMGYDHFLERANNRNDMASIDSLREAYRTTYIEIMGEEPFLF